MEDMKKLTPFKYFCLTNFPYIEADFDALTNYELFCKITEYLNEISKNNNALIDNFNELYNYVTDYFNNLDVTTEIDNKLEEMASDGTLTRLIKPFFDEAIEEVPDIVSDWIDANLSQETGYVIDTSLTVAGAGADAKATGDKIREINSELLVSYDIASEMTITEIVNGERYVSTGIQTNADYKRAKYLYPVKPFKLIHCTTSVANDDMAINFFDEDLNWISRRYIFNSSSLTPSCVAPYNACYFGFDVKTTNTNTSFKLYIVGDGKCDNIDRTFKDNLKSYLVEPDRVITTSGNMNTSENYDVIIVPNPNCDTMYCSFNVGSNAMIIKGDGTTEFLTATTVTGEDYSRRYTIPSYCKVLFICYPHSLQLNENGDIMSYVNLIRTNDNPLNKKRITCIGASATRLDQHQNNGAGTTGGVVGWQKWLKWNGAFCSNRGKNGYCYTVGYGSGSLYTDVVTNQMDLSNEDMVILFGGMNDAQYNAPVGNPPTDYSSYVNTPSTMCGAINGIIDYIRTNNPYCKIFIVAPYKSSLSSLGYTHQKEYVDAIRKCAEFWSVPYIDLFAKCDISPNVNSSDYLYDGIHPNSIGFENIGKIIVSNMLGELKYEG